MSNPNMKPLATMCETKLLRDAGLIYIHPDCHVTFTRRFRNANALKAIRDAAEDGTLYYRDFRLYLYPELKQVKPKKKGRCAANMGTWTQHTAKIKAFYASLPSGSTFTRTDLCKLCGLPSRARLSDYVNRTPEIKALLKSVRVNQQTYRKP